MGLFSLVSVFAAFSGERQEARTTMAQSPSIRNIVVGTLALLKMPSVLAFINTSTTALLRPTNRRSSSNAMCGAFSQALRQQQQQEQQQRKLPLSTAAATNSPVDTSSPDQEVQFSRVH